MHSIVDNETGLLQGDAYDTFKQFKLNVVPIQLFGFMDPLTMITKI